MTSPDGSRAITCLLLDRDMHGRPGKPQKRGLDDHFLSVSCVTTLHFYHAAIILVSIIAKTTFIKLSCCCYFESSKSVIETLSGFVLLRVRGTFEWVAPMQPFWRPKTEFYKFLLQNGLEWIRIVDVVDVFILFSTSMAWQKIITYLEICKKKCKKWMCKTSYSSSHVRPKRRVLYSLGKDGVRELLQ